MKRINWALGFLSVKEKHILKGLFSRRQNIDYILRERAAQECGHGTQLAAQVLQE
jgi:hypothetical protein